MAETLTIRTASSTEVVKIAVPGPQGPKGDKGDPGDVAGLPLTTLGDTLYRGASENQRLPIGTSGQILKVSAGGIPEWGAAPATGVTSVALASSDLTITGSPITSSGTITANVTVNGLTLNKLETIQSAHFLGRHGSGAGDVQPVSASQARTILNVADGAEANVQSNWTEADSGSDAFIQNKPATFAPSAHAASHASAGSDPLFDQDLNQADSVQFDGLRVVSAASQTVAKQVLVADDEGLIVGITGNEADARASLGLGDAATADIGTGSTEVAAGDHGHGNITSDGKIGSTAGLPVVTTTAGAVTTLALGTANQVLRVNSGASGVEFADPAASGVTGAASSASDVLGVSGSNITGVDAGTADRLVFWDDSAGKLTHLSLGSNALSIDGTTLKSQPMFSVDPISRGATYIPYIGSASNGNSSAAVNTGFGYVLFSPVYIRKSANYTTFSCIVASAGSASSLGKMALYSIKTTDATPDALVCESGTFATDSTGIKQPTMASTFVSEGWYYMALATNSTTNVLFYGDTMLLLRGVFSGAALNTQAALFDYSSKLYADLWPNPWNGTGSTFRNAFHPITSLT